MAKIEEALKVVFGHEGGYVNDPNDPGGETKYGICKKSYPSVDIANLTFESAGQIYRRDFWRPLYDNINSQKVATKLFSCGVNCGDVTAIKMMQRTLGVSPDGLFGYGTLAAVNAAEPDVLLAKFADTMKSHYDDLIAKNPHLAVYKNGWYKRAEWGVA